MSGRLIKSLSVAVVAVCMGLVAAPSMGAEGDESGRPPVAKRPRIAEHAFLENTVIPGPFVRSWIRNRVGVGQARNLDIPSYVIDDVEIPGLSGKLMFAMIDFEFQHAIKPWIALRARLGLTGRLGTNVQALLSEGVTMNVGYELGWLIRLAETRKTAWALDVGVSNRNYTGINLSRFVEDIIDGVDPRLVDTAPSTRGFGGVRFAWAASRLVGVTARGMTGFGESLDRRSADKGFFKLGTAVDFDIASRTGVPVALALAYNYDSFPEFTSDSLKGAHTVLMRISYVGRPDFLLSLDVGSEESPQPLTDKSVSGATIAVNMRYYF